MVHAMRIHGPGGPAVMVWEEIALDPPGPREARIRQTAIGLNFVDTYLRAGHGAFGDTSEPDPLEYPAILGFEGVGIVEAVGVDVHNVAVDDRVAYARVPMGAYAEARTMPADVLIKLPDSIEDRQAAAMMLKGMTAEYLLRRCHPVQPGQTILFHAAAGGCGLIACQWAQALGATVIGTVGSDEKARLARDHGCDHVIIYSRESVVDRVREITRGDGVPVVYDGVGAATFDQSLNCLAPRGMLVLFGQPSGPVGPLSLNALTDHGSLFLTRPGLMDYIAKREEMVAGANALFNVVARGDVRIDVRQTYALRDAATAHGDLAARRTTGSTVLIP